MIAAAAIAIPLLGLLPFAKSGYELAHLRNAVLLEAPLPPSFDWATAPSADFAFDRAPFDPYFTALAAQLKLAALPDDWSRALAIGSHLLGSAPLMGGGVKDSLRRTHRAITERGEGYCADFVDVFQAIASAAGLQVRAWAFSFDGFGGHGHIFIELWNRDLKRWQLIDVYNNFTFAVDDGAPLSAREFREVLTREPARLEFRAIEPRAPAGYAYRDKAIAYYQRGLDEWYLFWGSHVLASEQSLAYRAVAPLSQAAGEAAAMLAGGTPRVRPWPTAANAERIDALRLVKFQLWATAVAVAAGIALWLALIVTRGRGRKALPALVPEAARMGWPRVCIVGPLPSPAGGMANQCEQLHRLLSAEGAEVSVVRSNSPYRPAWVGALPVVRAIFRLMPYALSLLRKVGQADVVHLFSNSGWAWHFFSAPALLAARLRRRPVIVNYRGGNASPFLASAPVHVLRSLRAASLRVAPSAYLQRVFAQHGLAAEVVPNIIDLSRFTPVPPRAFGDAPRLLVARNLEPIYDIATALRAFALIHQVHAHARLTVAGTGPERERLTALAAELGVAGAVAFVGRIDNAEMPRLYAQSDLALNPSTVDNMPISLLEAFASGVPVVSTNAGGIPDMLEAGRDGLLVPVGDANAMAREALRIFGDEALRRRLIDAGLVQARRYAWPVVREQWRAAYWRAVAQGGAA